MERPLLALALAAASWLAGARAEAEPPAAASASAPRSPTDPPASSPPLAPRVRLAYRAALDCPDEATFLQAVAAQSRPFQRAPRSAARVRALDAIVERRGDTFVGLLRVREADGAASEREVSGATCPEVFSALALVAAITIDNGPPEPRPPPPDPPPHPPPPSARRFTIATAVLTGAFFSMAKEASWGVAPSLQLSTPIGGVPFGIQLGGVLAASPSTSTTAGSADFLFVGGRLAASAGLLSAGWLAVHLTAGADAGVVRGRGRDIRKPDVRHRPWVDLALGARAELMFHTDIGLDVAGGMLIPLTRPRWIFEEPDFVVYETPLLGAYFTVGIRVVLTQ